MTDERIRAGRLARLARERERDRAEGRPERGLFTGRGAEGRRSRFRRADVNEQDELREAPRTSRDAEYSDKPDDEHDDEHEESEDEARPRTGMKRSVMSAIRLIPSYVRLLFGLLSDGRVSKFDRVLVLAAAAYIVSPLDLIPDVIPFLGQVDDIFLLTASLQRLVERSGRRVLLDHWSGEPEELDDMNLASVASAASFFLPPRMKRRLRRMAGRRS